MPRSVDMKKVNDQAELLAWTAIPAAASNNQKSKALAKSWLTEKVGTLEAKKKAPYLFDKDDPDPPAPKAAPAAGIKAKLEAKGGRMRKAKGGHVKSFFSSY